MAPITSSPSSTMPTALRKYRQYAFPAALAVLLIFHGVGLWGLLWSGNSAYFQRLTPLNLLLTNALLFSFHRHWSWAFLRFAGVAMVTGFLVEVLGVHTGLIFGDYRYGEALGLKLWDVPLLIGLNWLMLVYTTATISGWLRVPLLAKAVVGASLMVLLDYFIEPVAMAYDFWDWQGGQVPVANFIGWFAVAFLLQLYCHWGAFHRQNPLAVWVYAVQLLFFISLFSAL